MIRLNLFMIWFLHFLSLLSVICRCYRQSSSSRIIVVLVYTVSTLFAYFFVRIPKTDKESFLQDKVFGTHVFYLCLRKKTNELYNLPL